MEMDRAERATAAPAAVFFAPNSQQRGIGENSDRLAVPLLNESANFFFHFSPDLGSLLSLNSANLLYLLTP